MRDFGDLGSRYEAAADDSTVARLATQLGVSAESLRRLHIGHDGRAYTFPMRTPDGLVCGIRLRYPSGRKLSVKGGREGLFLPADVPSDGPLFVAEGPTDCAALLDLGFSVIGRPSCRGAVRLTRDVCRGRDVVVFADGDAPGQTGARTLACTLALYCQSVRLIRPPDGAKDVRQWVQRGATRADVQRLVECAARETVTLTTKRRTA